MSTQQFEDNPFGEPLVDNFAVSVRRKKEKDKEGKRRKLFVIKIKTSYRNLTNYTRESVII